MYSRKLCVLYSEFLKGQCYEIFDFRFSIWISLPKPLVEIFAAGVIDTGGKFATSINNTSETGGKIAAGVIDTGGAPGAANIS
jgi:hypothetical protein